MITLYAKLPDNISYPETKTWGLQKHHTITQTIWWKDYNCSQEIYLAKHINCTRDTYTIHNYIRGVKAQNIKLK